MEAKQCFTLSQLQVFEIDQSSFFADVFKLKAVLTSSEPCIGTLEGLLLGPALCEVVMGIRESCRGFGESLMIVSARARSMRYLSKHYASTAEQDSMICALALHST